MDEIEPIFDEDYLFDEKHKKKKKVRKGGLVDFAIKHRKKVKKEKKGMWWESDSDIDVSGN